MRSPILFTRSGSARATTARGSLTAPGPLSALAAFLTLGALGALAAGCGGEGRGSAGRPGPSEPEAPARFSTSLSLSSGRPAPGERFEATAAYAIDPVTDRLGAFVVEIGFDPAAVRFVDAHAPAGSGRVVNALRADAGSLVLAGVSGEGFTDGILFRGTFEALASGVGTGSFSLRVREASDTSLSHLVE